MAADLDETTARAAALKRPHPPWSSRSPTVVWRDLSQRMQDERSIPDFLVEIAPRDLPVNRAERYRGDQMSAQLDELSAADLASVKQLYVMLQEAQATLRQTIDREMLDAGSLEALASHPRWTEMVAVARSVNASLPTYPARIGRVLHDVRGGSLAALIGTVQLLPFSVSVRNEVERCTYYARDHLKIMRNCFPEIDAAAGARDREGRAHSVRLLVEKWADGAFRFENADRRVRFACTFEGAISERCMEFSALDRVVYNLVNNAARHTADGTLGLFIFPTRSERAENIRFAITNPIGAEHAAKLSAMTGGDLQQLMRGGTSTTGGGIGLRICAEFVMHAYGQRSIADTVTQGYAGTKLVGDQFVSWFHWPAAA